MPFDALNLDLEDFKRLLNKQDFDEAPVDLATFVSDPYFLGLPKLSKLQLEIAFRMSQVYFEETLIDLYGQEKGKDMWEKTVNEVVCEIGKGGGKDFVIRVAFCYIIYLLHCLRDPLHYYQKGKGEYIDLLNIALNADQAKNVFFDPMRNILTQSPYFQEKGMELRAREIMFMDRPIRCFSGHSGYEGWEGYNLIAVVLDEISAFKTDSELAGEKNRYAASSIYNMSKNSVISRFPSVGKVALLSFPRYRDDYIEEKYKTAIAEKKTFERSKVIGIYDEKKVEISWEEDEIIKYARPNVWAIKCPSWYTNPERQPEDYLSTYLENPIETAAKFFCMPPFASQAYFRDPDRVHVCFPKDQELYPTDEFGRFKDWFKADKSSDDVYWIHIDLGLNRDRSALCMVHPVGAKSVKTFDGTDNVIHKLPIIKMDIIKYWEAPTNGEIDFNDVRNFAFELANRFPIALISIDRWNSLDTTKIFQSRGISTEMHVVDKKDYDTLSTSIYDGRLIGYHDEILVDQELLKLQLLKGKKVDHVRTGFKDGSDCLAGAVWYCTQYTPIDQEIELSVLGERTTDEQERRREVNKKVPEQKEMPPDLSDFLDGLQVF